MSGNYPEESIKHSEQGESFEIKNISAHSDIGQNGGRFKITELKSKEGKGKAVPLQASSGPEGCRKLKLPDFVTTAQDGGKVVSLTHRPPLPQGNTPGTHFC